MNTRVDHEAILASAGSGKTYQLANRIVRLLASGADAGTILALTFTRKAAGEFARRTLVKLAAAAQSDATARSLAE
ncbi:MAG: UvrD-helicase domain-containing protein [Puniceicoccales bacterium]|jgi:ATP-dependent exoDNAse (exonuclease V) beta subunit|nr:UvrD-helicase domain-containing protein [Puniceicoccales bacterium]